MRIILLLFTTLLSINLTAQSTLPYREIPDHPDVYSAGAVAARMIDGLGFRFYWSTDSLRETDLDYRPNAESRSTLETVEHIQQLVLMISKALKMDVMIDSNQSFEQQRSFVLTTLSQISSKLRNSSEEDLKTYQVLSSSGVETPFWFFINGPIADAIWHCGQIASFRRSSGNPINSSISHFRGTVKD